MTIDIDAVIVITAEDMAAIKSPEEFLALLDSKPFVSLSTLL